MSNRSLYRLDSSVLNLWMEYDNFYSRFFHRICLTKKGVGDENKEILEKETGTVGVGAGVFWVLL